jgi:TetR/AcrR family transcriptional regulator, fatty acid metabolism regulator protein
MPRQDTSTERKNHILDAAASVFAGRGYHQTRMDDIVQESGLSKGAIYWYFKSKDDLFTALIERIFSQEVREIQALLDADTPIALRLLDFTRMVIHDMHQFETLGVLPLIYEFYAETFRHEKLQHFLQTYYHTSSDLLSRLIQQGIAQGEIRPVDPQQTSFTIIALYEGTILLWVFHQHQFSLEHQLLNSMQQLLTGLLVEPVALAPLQEPAT